MAKIIGTHKNGGMAAACQGKMQITIIEWNGEPTAEQLKQYPSSEWCAANGVGKSGEDVYGYDGSDEPVRSAPSQTNGFDKAIWTIALLPFVCLFVAWVLR